MGRRSVRTFDGRLLNNEDLKKIEELTSKADNPYGIEIEYRFLKPEEYGLKSPVLSGETLYLGAKVKRLPQFEEAFGYSLESIVMGAWDLGIGTVWIGGTMNRSKFEEAMELKDDEVMPCITPLGYPAEKMAFKEAAMRKGVRADWRYELSEIVYENKPGESLTRESLKKYGKAFESVRWAPSAVNKQPWRLIVKDNTVYFYEKKDKGYDSEATGDLQKVDAGIAMYHFFKAMKEEGRNPVFTLDDPGISVPEDWHYIAGYRE